MNNIDFDPKCFLGAKVVSPLEQQKLVGGLIPTDQSVTVSTSITISIVVVDDGD